MAEIGDRLLDALATLPEADRELLMLVAWEGLEPSEIGQLLGMRPGRSRSDCTAPAGGARNALSRQASILTAPQEARS